MKDKHHPWQERGVLTTQGTGDHVHARHTSMPRMTLSHWQLDLFTFAMIIGALACFRLGVSDGHETLFGVVWSTITLSGMAVWVYKNEPALRADEQLRRKSAHGMHARWSENEQRRPRVPVQQASREHEETQRGQDSAPAEREMTAEAGPAHHQCIAAPRAREEEDHEKSRPAP